jgi:hypothetical protein
MSTNKIILRNSHGAEVAAIFLDEESRRWRIVSKGEPKFKRDFVRAAFTAAFVRPLGSF